MEHLVPPFWRNQFRRFGGTERIAFYRAFSRFLLVIPVILLHANTDKLGNLITCIYDPEISFCRNARNLVFDKSLIHKMLDSCSLCLFSVGGAFLQIILGAVEPTVIVIAIVDVPCAFGNQNAEDLGLLHADGMCKVDTGMDLRRRRKKLI